MTWIWLVAGLVVGAGGTGITLKLLEKSEPVAPTVVSEGQAVVKQQEVVLQLTDLDLIKEACSSQFIVTDKQSAILCREMFCRMQQRGVDAKTGSSECEKISNVANKIAIHDFCTKSVEEEKAIEGSENVHTIVDPDKLKGCIDFFDRRI